jgi:F0F1-type ATP synthase assembly protein I
MPTGEQNPFGRGLGQGYSYVAASFAFALAILLFGALGWLVDGWLHTRPAFAIAGALLGGFGGFMSLYYRVQRDIAQQKKDKGQGTGAGS